MQKNAFLLVLIFALPRAVDAGAPSVIKPISASFAGKSGGLSSSRNRKELTFVYETNRHESSALWGEVEEIWWRLKRVAEKRKCTVVYIDAVYKKNRRIRKVFFFSKSTIGSSWVLVNKL